MKLLPLVVGLATASRLTIDYRLNPVDEQLPWKEYAAAEVLVPTSETLSKDYEGGRVVKTLEGNGRAIAEYVWSQYEGPKQTDLYPRLEWRLTFDNSTASLTSISMAQVKSERHLAKILSNIEAHLLFDKSTFISGNVRVPWEFLTDADSSSTRLGTVYVIKPQPPTTVVEEPPKRRPAKLSQLEAEEWQNKPPVAEPSFWRKYWWLFLVGYFLLNTLFAQPPEAAEAPPANPAPAAAKAKAGNKRH